MLCSHLISFDKTRFFCYKALQNAKILKLPLYNCETSFYPTRYMSSHDPCNPCGRRAEKRAKPSVIYKMFVPQAYKDHDHKNMALGRPMSPHLTIYAPTVPSMTSIFQRITGITTAICALLLSGGTLFLADGIGTYVTMLQSLELSHRCALIVKVLVGLPFAFHYFNGIRFCAWNAGQLLGMSQIYSTANMAMIATVVGAIFFAMF